MTVRARRLIVAVVSGVLGRGVGLIAPLLIMGPMLTHLGPDLFGMWLTALAVTAMASFLDFGIGNATLTRLAEAFGRDDPAAVRRILGEAYTLLGGISVGLLAVVAVGVVLAPLLMPEAVASGQVALLAVVLVALFLSFPTLMIWRLLQARHAFVQSQLAQMAGPLLALLACLGAIRAEAHPIMVVAFYALTNTVVQLLWTLVYFLRNPLHRPQFAQLDRRSMRSMLALGGAFFVLSIFSLSGMNSDNVILAARAGAAVVAEYGVPAKLGSILMMIVGTVFMPLWPLFGDALARRDKAWLLKTTRRMSIGGAVCVCAIGLMLTALADPIMSAWMGRAFADQKLILLGWTAATTVIAFTAPYNMVLNAAGLARPQILPWAAFVLISFAAKALLLTPETAWWAPWITAAVYVVTISPWMIAMGRKVCNRSDNGVG